MTATTVVTPVTAHAPAASSSGGNSSMFDNQATVRHGAPSNDGNGKAQGQQPPRSPTKMRPNSNAIGNGNGRTLADDIVDDEEEEDYGVPLDEEGPYPPMVPQHDHMSMPDTAMLDSVVLPAIASVRTLPVFLNTLLISLLLC